MELKELDFYIGYLERNRYSKRGLLVGFFVFPSILLLLTILLKVNLVGWYWILTVVVVDLVWLLYWIWNRNQYPKVARNEVGIVLAIETEKDLERTRVYQDFIGHFNKLINESGFSDVFEVVELNEFQSNITSKLLNEHSQSLSQFRKNGTFSDQVKLKKWEAYQKKIGGHLYIWGKIRKRFDKDSK